jgi:hypothetical protein
MIMTHLYQDCNGNGAKKSFQMKDLQIIFHLVETQDDNQDVVFNQLCKEHEAHLSEDHFYSIQMRLII